MCIEEQTYAGVVRIKGEDKVEEVIDLMSVYQGRGVRHS